jgi:hypothetical protein
LTIVIVTPDSWHHSLSAAGEMAGESESRLSRSRARKETSLRLQAGAQTLSAASRNSSVEYPPQPARWQANLLVDFRGQGQGKRGTCSRLHSEAHIFNPQLADTHVLSIHTAVVFHSHSNGTVPEQIESRHSRAGAAESWPS